MYTRHKERRVTAMEQSESSASDRYLKSSNKTEGIMLQEVPVADPFQTAPLPPTQLAPARPMAGLH